MIHTLDQDNRPQHHQENIYQFEDISAFGTELNQITQKNNTS